MGLLKQITLNDFDLDANFSSEEEVLNVQGGGRSTKTLSKVMGVTPATIGKVYKVTCPVYNTWSDGKCFDKTTWSENC